MVIEVAMVIGVEKNDFFNVKRFVGFRKLFFSYLLQEDVKNF